jgi:type IV pilus assembly protein PilO
MNILEELRSLDPRDPGRWPLPVLAGAVLAAFLVLSGVGIYLLVWKAGRPSRRRKAREETELWFVETKAKKAANLQAYKDQLAEMESPSAPCCASCRTRPSAQPPGRHFAERLAAGLEEKLFSRKARFARTSTRVADPYPTHRGYHEMGASRAASRRCRESSLHDIEINRLHVSATRAVYPETSCST